MEAFVVRLWLPDRPGALGAVASRIGAVRGDVVGIDILERGADRVIDELVVELPDAKLLSLLVAEISEVDGVDVEDVRPARGEVHDARLDALETAEVLVGATAVGELRGRLVEHAVHDFAGEWCVLTGLDGARPAAVMGSPPAAAWLRAFVEASKYAVDARPEDVAWAPLPDLDRVVVLGRAGRPFRGRERRQLAALARITAHRWRQLDADAVPAHPRERSTARRQPA